MDALAGFSAFERRRIRRTLGARAKLTGYTCFAMERRRAPMALRQSQPLWVQQREDDNRRAWSALGEAERMAWRQRADAAHVTTVGDVAALATAHCPPSATVPRTGVASALTPSISIGGVEALNTASDTFETLCRAVSEDARAWKTRPMRFLWTRTERKLLEKLVELHGGDWKKVALGLPHRAHHANLPRLCRRQWLSLVAVDRRALSARALDATRGAWPSPYAGVAWDVYAARWFYFTTTKERARCRNLSAKRKQAGQDGAENRRRMYATAFAAAVAHDTAVVQSIAAPRASDASTPLVLNFSSAAAIALGATIRFPLVIAPSVGAATAGGDPAPDGASPAAVAARAAPTTAVASAGAARPATVARAHASAAERSPPAPLAVPSPAPSDAPRCQPRPSQQARTRPVDYYSATADIAAAGERAMRCVPTLRDLEEERGALAVARDVARDAALQRARDASARRVRDCAAARVLCESVRASAAAAAAASAAAVAAMAAASAPLPDRALLPPPGSPSPLLRGDLVYLDGTRDAAEGMLQLSPPRTSRRARLSGTPSVDDWLAPEDDNSNQRPPPGFAAAIGRALGGLQRLSYDDSTMIGFYDPADGESSRAEWAGQGQPLTTQELETLRGGGESMLEWNRTL